MARKPRNDNRLVSMTTAIAEMKKEHPEVTEHALRNAVAGGKVPFQRSSDAKKARYFIRVKDLRDWYRSLGTIACK
jgi:hypothetical protein